MVQLTRGHKGIDSFCCRNLKKLKSHKERASGFLLHKLVSTSPIRMNCETHEAILRSSSVLSGAGLV